MEKENINFIPGMLKPWELLLNSIFYFMGAGLANYLGRGINWGIMIEGLVLIVAIQIGAFALDIVYWQIEHGYKLQRDPFPLKPDDPRNLGRKQLIYAFVLSVISLGIGILILSNLTKNHSINLSSYLFLGIFMLLYFVYAIPPFRAGSKGYGEMILAIQGAYVIPTLAYLFQTGDLHRLILSTAIPLSLLYLAMELTRSLKGFSKTNEETPRGKMVNRIGPERSLQVVIYLILVAYLIVGIESFLGLSWSIFWRFLLSLPVGLFLGWQIYRIRSGKKPNWGMLDVTAIFLVGLSAYFIAVGFWTG